MAKTEAKGTVTPLASMFPAEEAQKAAKRVEEATLEKQNEMNQLREFIADNASLINLVQKLPDELHHDIMVPFGKAAFFPGRLIHTNEFLVLLGENYYAERTAKQTVEILKRRGKSLESKVDGLKAVMQDLKAEASFFDSTASEVAEGLVEIREEIEEENSTATVSQSGQLGRESPSLAEADDTKGASKDDKYARMMSRLEELEKEELAAESNEENDNKMGTSQDDEHACIMPRLDKLEKEELAGESNEENDNKMGTSQDDEYARIMSRLDELEKEELAAENNGENDEDQDVDAAEIDGDEDEQTKVVFHPKKDEGYSSLDHDHRYSEVYQSRKPEQQSKGKDSMNDDMSNKYHHQDLTNQLACTGLTVEPVNKGEMSQSRITPQETKILNPSKNASMPFEKKVRFEAEDSTQNKKSVKTSKSEFDSSKAFTGSIVEHTENLEQNLPGQTKTSSQLSGSQPSKPVSRFKMQRK